MKFFPKEYFLFQGFAISLRRGVFSTGVMCALTDAILKNRLLKLSQNKKGRKNLRYPTKKQSFFLEKDCFLSGTSNFYGPSYFETTLMKIFCCQNGTNVNKQTHQQPLSFNLTIQLGR